MVPAPWSKENDEIPTVAPVRRMALRMRLGLALTASLLVGVFVLAWCIHPRDGEGKPLLRGTHQQLWLPPCTFQALTGKPCPACGMTTSFSHLVHGDPANSFRANPAGILLAAALIILILIFVVSASLGRRWVICNYEKFFVRSMILTYGLMFAVWIVRMLSGI
jgi:hypothetical protein